MRGVSGEHAAAAVAGEFEAGVAQGAHGAIEPDRRDLVAPGIDGADAVAGAGLDDVDQRTLLTDCRRVQRQPAVITA